MSLLAARLQDSKHATTVVAMHTDKKDEWLVLLTYFQNEEPIFTLTSVHRNLHEAYRLLESVATRVDSDYAAGWLTLPDMGDFQVEYHKDST